MVKVLNVTISPSINKKLSNVSDNRRCDMKFLVFFSFNAINSLSSDHWESCYFTGPARNAACTALKKYYNYFITKNVWSELQTLTFYAKKRII